MKKTILLALATLFATVSFAQQQLATLNHNDSIRVFYGESALSEAHSAAATGDIITLSPGRFLTSGSLTITKAVTIRGAGMMRDTLGNASTDIVNDIFLEIPNDSTHNLVLEGLCFGNIYWTHVYRPRIIKCKINNMPENYYYGGSYFMENAQIINCIVNGFSSQNQSNTQFINSVIFYIISPEYGGMSFINSIVNISNSENALSNNYFINSILYDKWGYDYNSNNNATTCFYSLGILPPDYYNNNSYYFDTMYTPDHNLRNYNEYNSVFKTFTGEYSEGETFELQDAVANTILGDDSTQVGIYGGPFPFNPNVRNPRIKRCTVAQRATQDNKLAVDIEVVSE